MIGSNPPDLRRTAARQMMPPESITSDVAANKMIPAFNGRFAQVISIAYTLGTITGA